jgi:GNAT superfamily N-acetyltransferase
VALRVPAGEGGAVIRPLTPEDVVAARSTAWAALRDLDERTGEEPMTETPLRAARSDSRIAWLQRTDPAGAWVAEVDGAVVGCALALVRDGMWFLSLLMVRPGHQHQGLGRQLLEAALRTRTDRSWILASTDPAALRRYQRAGFALHPTFTAKGVVDRSLLAAAPGVRAGSFTADAGLVADVSTAVRGASLEPDLPWFAESGHRFWVVPGRGYLLLAETRIAQLTARDEATARALLWTALAEADGEIEVDWLAADAQWAVDVTMAARLTYRWGGTICLSGQPPMPYALPSGAFG